MIEKQREREGEWILIQGIELNYIHRFFLSSLFLSTMCIKTPAHMCDDRHVPNYQIKKERRARMSDPSKIRCIESTDASILLLKVFLFDRVIQYPISLESKNCSMCEIHSIRILAFGTRIRLKKQ